MPFASIFYGISCETTASICGSHGAVAAVIVAGDSAAVIVVAVVLIMIVVVGC